VSLADEVEAERLRGFSGTLRFPLEHVFLRRGQIGPA